MGAAYKREEGMAKDSIKSYFVCERCGAVHNQLQEPDRCGACSAEHPAFVWFQSQNEEYKAYVARFAKS